jgi:carbonic anhydrase
MFCTLQNTQWFVLGEVLTVSERQLAVFRQAIDEVREEIAPNFRNVQPLNERVVLDTTAEIERVPWNYDGFGADWGLDYPFCGGGLSTEFQSPIRLPADDGVESPGPNMQIFYEEETVSLVNTGRGLRAEVSTENLYEFVSPAASIRPSQTYSLTHVEFKWAQNSVNGSEHWIGTDQYPFEIQFVHWNTKYTSYEQARAMYDGIAVVSVLVDNTAKNTALDPVVNALDGIASGESSDVKLDLLGLLPADTSRYYSYLGSMTTPECYEVAQWFVLKNVQSINNAQLAKFRSLATTSYRELQPRNERIIIDSQALVADWDHGFSGDDWGASYPSCGSGLLFEKQSPIDLPPPITDVRSNTGFFVDYKWVEDVQLVNTGTSVRLEMPEGTLVPMVSPQFSKRKSALYSLSHVEFHWGTYLIMGSEHTIDGEKYPMEMQYIHWNSRYATIEEARGAEDGLLIISVLIGVNETVGATENVVLQKNILDNIGEIQEASSSYAFEKPFDPEILLPKNRQHWTYLGSRTEPGCEESVQWVVLQETLSVTFVQYLAFQGAENENGNPVVLNFRNIQPSNGREIFDTSADDDEAAWNYALGGDNWNEDFPTCGKGLVTELQSPIDIPQELVDDVEAASNPPLYVDYSRQSYVTVRQSGAGAVQIDMDTGHFSAFYPPASATAHGKPLAYTLRHITARLSDTNDEGSEHTIAGEDFPLEIQLVHWNTKYPTYEVASTMFDGIAIISILYKLGGSPNQFLSPIVSGAALLAGNVNEVKVTGFEPKKLFFEDVEEPLDSGYWTYRGSVTEPPCQESVLWFVMKAHPTIGNAQLENLRGAASFPQGRNVQKTNGRAILQSTSLYAPLVSGNQLSVDTVQTCGSGLIHEKQSPIDLPLHVEDTNFTAAIIPVYSDDPFSFDTVYPGFTHEIDEVVEASVNVGYTLWDEFELKVQDEDMHLTFDESHLYPIRTPQTNLRSPGTYTLHDAAFHAISEHTIGGESFPFELQLTHWNVEFDSYLQASQSAEGLVGLSILFEISESDNVALAPLVDYLVQRASDCVVQDCPDDFEEPVLGSSIDVADLIPFDQGFWSYEGSLTKAPCTETVQWFVFKDIQPIGQNQLDTFLQLASTTRRTLQPTNGREIIDSSEMLVASKEWNYDLLGRDWGYEYPTCGDQRLHEIQAPIDIPHATKNYNTMCQSHNSAEDGYCTSDCPCFENEGDCDSDSHCADSLLCGEDNCPAWMDDSLDCCYDPVKSTDNGNPTLDVRYAAVNDVVLHNTGKNLLVVFNPEEFWGLRTPDSAVQRSDSYALSHARFMYGESNFDGTEHSIGEEKFAMEMQIVHWNTKYFDYKTAVTKSDGIVVVVVMFEVGDTNVALTPIVNEIQALDASLANFTVLASFDIGSLVSVRDGFWTYKGSISQPSCEESAQYFVMHQRSYASQVQLTKLRNSQSVFTRQTMAPNLRAAQPENGRILVDSHAPSIDKDVDQWDYSVGGMDWYWEHPTCGEGNLYEQQSPIVLPTPLADTNTAQPALMCGYYKTLKDVYILNTGKSLEINVGDDFLAFAAPQISSTLSEVYTLNSVVMHWSAAGGASGSGSEHRVGTENDLDNVGYDIEMQFVHWNTKYDDFNTAKTMEDGIAILAVFFEAGGEANEGLADIFNAASNVRTPDSTPHLMEMLDVTAILPSKLERYWSYDGSFTKPNCYESVKWFVLQDILQVSSNQLNQLRSLVKTDGTALSPNSRVLQPLNGRDVFDSTSTPEEIVSWSYDRDGNDWYSHHQTCGAGKIDELQSPISLPPVQLNSTAVLPSSTIGIFYDKPVPGAHFQFADGEWSLQMPEDRPLPLVTPQTPLRKSSTYSLNHIEFHFHGNASGVGSEHAVDGVHTALEMQFYHWNMLYPSYRQASYMNDGIVVLSVMFNVSTTDEHEPFNDILSAWENSGTNVRAVEDLNPRTLLPDDVDLYWSYLGSFSQPGCLQSVQWFVDANTFSVSMGQLERFRAMVVGTERFADHNTRELQPDNGRQVLGVSENVEAVLLPTKWVDYHSTLHWSDISKMCGTGLKSELQSPIELPTPQCEDCHKTDLALSYLSSNMGLNLANTGYLAKVSFPTNSNRFVVPQTVYRDSSVYFLSHIEFHWGFSNDDGSEHSVSGGRRWPMEAHLIHWNSKYSDYSEASSKVDGLAAIAVFFEVGSQNNGLRVITDKLGDVVNAGSEVTVDEFDPSWVVPSRSRDGGIGSGSYWSYMGSLTQPECFESVQWFVMQQPITISSSQLSQFRFLLNFDGVAHAPVRPLQNVNGRTIVDTSGDSMLLDWSHDTEANPTSTEFWYLEIPLCGEGQIGERQSPVDLPAQTQSVQSATGLPLFLSYASVDKMLVRNTGNFLRITVPADSYLEFVTPATDVRGSKAYALGYIEVHWGGSEHTVAGKAHTLEIQLWHWNVEYASMEQASAMYDGLAVISMFLDEGAENVPLSAITETLDNVINAGTGKRLPRFDPEIILPKFTGHYWTYEGSISNPEQGCYESVQWFVLQDVGSLGTTQLNAFKALRGIDGLPIASNARPVQPLNGRLIVDSVAILDAPLWSFSNVENWHYSYPQCGDGLMTEQQSPIVFVQPSADANQHPLHHVLTVDTLTNAKLLNTGFGMQLSIPEPEPVTLFSAENAVSHAAVFELSHVDFRVGETEHRVTGTASGVLEVQLVHWDTKYVNYEHAKLHESGILTVAVMYESGAEDPFIGDLVNLIPDIVGPGIDAVVPQVDISSLLSAARESAWWAYEGSETSPGCFENIQWVVLQDVLSVSPEQLDVLKLVQNIDTEVFNVRRPQNLNERVVLDSTQFEVPATEWSYDSNGRLWQQEFPLCGNRELSDMQSPIDLRSNVNGSLVQNDMSLEIAYPAAGSFTMFNMADSLRVKLDSGQESVFATKSTEVRNGETYALSHVDMKWAAESSAGSEHTVDGKAFPLEIQLMHYNTKYANYEEASRMVDGIAGLSLLFVSDDDDKASDNEYKGITLDGILNSASSVQVDGSEASITGLNLAELLPNPSTGMVPVSEEEIVCDGLCKYFTYEGSLTTPPCSETVQWFILQVYPTVTEQQLGVLRSLRGRSSLVVSSNYREPQPRNGRLVVNSAPEPHFGYLIMDMSISVTSVPSDQKLSEVVAATVGLDSTAIASIATFDDAAEEYRVEVVIKIGALGKDMANSEEWREDFIVPKPDGDFSIWKTYNKGAYNEFVTLKGVMINPVYLYTLSTELKRQDFEIDPNAVVISSIVYERLAPPPTSMPTPMPTMAPVPMTVQADNTILIALIAVLFVAVIGLAVLVLYRKRKKKQKIMYAQGVRAPPNDAFAAGYLAAVKGIAGQNGPPPGAPKKGPNLSDSDDEEDNKKKKGWASDGKAAQKMREDQKAKEAKARGLQNKKVVPKAPSQLPSLAAGDPSNLNIDNMPDITKLPASKPKPKPQTNNYKGSKVVPVAGVVDMPGSKGTKPGVPGASGTGPPKKIVVEPAAAPKPKPKPMPAVGGGALPVGLNIKTNNSVPPGLKKRGPGGPPTPGGKRPGPPPPRKKVGPPPPRKTGAPGAKPGTPGAKPGTPGAKPGTPGGGKAAGGPPLMTKKPGPPPMGKKPAPPPPKKT